MIKKTFYPRHLYIRNPNEISTFDSGDEFTRLIFVSEGSEETTYHDYEDDRDYDTVECHMIDLFTGEVMSWGQHMFVDMNTMSQYIKAINYSIENNPVIMEKLMYDVSHDTVLSGFSFQRGMFVVNAVVNHARLIVKGLEEGRLTIPENIVCMFDEKSDNDDYSYDVRTIDTLINEIKEIAALDLFPLKSMAEIQMETRRRKEKEIAEREAKKAAESNSETPDKPERSDMLNAINKMQYEESDHPMSWDDKCEQISDAIEDAEE